MYILRRSDRVWWVSRHNLFLMNMMKCLRAMKCIRFMHAWMALDDCHNGKL